MLRAIESISRTESSPSGTCFSIKTPMRIRTIDTKVNGTNLLKLSEGMCVGSSGGILKNEVFVADRYLATVKMIEPIEGLSPVASRRFHMLEFDGSDGTLDGGRWWHSFGRRRG